ncbi:MAG: hypothetical protein JOZ10_19225 [Acidobacteria bacterium]|nr:hypothetical protein [Acidobacteriota bacterium]
MQRIESEAINGAPFGNGRRKLEVDQISHLAEALRELYNLLEAYAPAWYTERERDKALSALQLLE